MNLLPSMSKSHRVSGYALGVREDNRPFVYQCCCIEALGEDINEMRDHPKCRMITYRTFRKHCAGVREWAKALGYDRWLPISKCQYVAFYKSFYQDRPCYYAVHSAIEFIWTEEET